MLFSLMIILLQMLTFQKMISMGECESNKMHVLDFSRGIHSPSALVISMLCLLSMLHKITIYMKLVP